MGFFFCRCRPFMCPPCLPSVTIGRAPRSPFHHSSDAIPSYHAGMYACMSIRTYMRVRAVMLEFYLSPSRKNGTRIYTIPQVPLFLSGFSWSLLETLLRLSVANSTRVQDRISDPPLRHHTAMICGTQLLRRYHIPVPGKYYHRPCYCKSSIAHYLAHFEKEKKTRFMTRNRRATRTMHPFTVQRSAG